jgi:hypothetical protein
VITRSSLRLGWLLNSEAVCRSEGQMPQNQMLRVFSSEVVSMEISTLSNTALKDLHSVIVKRKADEFAVPPAKQVYGVRKYPDWKEQADAFEAEMKKRGIAFRPIKWD